MSTSSANTSSADTTGADTTGADTSSAGYFEAIYRSTKDPWRFSDDPYERSRFAAIAGALPLRRFRCAFEPGCSEGELTVLLARRCDRYIAIDISPTAAARAAARCVHLPQVHVCRGSIPADVPQEPLDLLVLSEIGYYFDEARLRDLVQKLHLQLTSDATVVACHWLGSSDDHVLGGDAVHAVLAEELGAPDHSARTDRYRLDVWSSTQ